MISRTLGPEWGGAIGVVFSFANAGMAALNIVGFSESMIALLKANGVQIVDGGQNDNRIISCAAIILLQSIIIIGMEWEAKVSVFRYHSCGRYIYSFLVYSYFEELFVPRIIYPSSHFVLGRGNSN